MERQQREFLKVIRKNLIYPFLFLFIMVCLALSPERGVAQFFPVPFGPFMGAPFGGFSPVSAFGGFAPMGLPSLPFAATPYSMPVSAVSGLAGLMVWQAPTPYMPCNLSDHFSGLSLWIGYTLLSMDNHPV